MFAVTATATLPAAVGCGSSSTIVPRCTKPPSLLARRLLLHLPLAELVARHTEIAMKTTAAILASQPKPQGIVGQALAWTCGVMANHPVGGTFCSVVTGRTTTPAEASNRDTEKENSPAAPAERSQATMFGDGPERTIASQELDVRVAPMQPGDFGTSGSAGGGPVRMCRHLRSATALGQERDGEPPSKRGMRRRPGAVSCMRDGCSRSREKRDIRTRLEAKAPRMRHRSRPRDRVVAEFRSAMGVMAPALKAAKQLCRPDPGQTRLPRH